MKWNRFVSSVVEVEIAAVPSVSSLEVEFRPLRKARGDTERRDTRLVDRDGGRRKCGCRASAETKHRPPHSWVKRLCR